MLTIWTAGYNRQYLRRPWRSFDLSEWVYCVYTDPREVEEPPVRDTILVNRAQLSQARLLS